MNATKTTLVKRSSKQDREHRVLLGLVAHYLKTGKPVGSHTLKEAGFEDLSSATIRNYFAKLEEEGYLIQQHTSGGRIPTHSALRVYANEYIDTANVPKEAQPALDTLRRTETKETTLFLQQAAEMLSGLTHAAVFLSAPRFDQDYIVDIKLVPVDNTRCVCVIVTDFGVIQTEVIHTETKLSAFTAKRIESYVHWRLTNHDEPENLRDDELQLALKIYNELMLRYIVSYSNFVDTELYRTGFAKLVEYPDFRDASVLANSLALFENAHNMRLLVKECCKHNQLKCWIGDDLSAYTSSTPNCTIIAVPYMINQNIVGAVGILAPSRVPYPELFGIMRGFANSVGETLTRNLFKFKITFRQPHSDTRALQKEEYRLVDQSKTQPMLLENKN